MSSALKDYGADHIKVLEGLEVYVSAQVCILVLLESMV